MTLRNERTGDTLEFPKPNALGETVLKLNGEVIERVLCSDENGGSITLGDGRMFRPGVEFAEYIIATYLKEKQPQ